MWPNTEFFLVRIFPYSDQMPENTAMKKLSILTFFTQWWLNEIYLIGLEGLVHVMCSVLFATKVYFY